MYTLISAATTFLNASDWIAIAAGIIAISSLGLSLFLGWKTIKHNKLSVRPHLGLETFFDTENSPITIKLSNHGIGPAIITKLLLSVNDTFVEVTSHGHFHDILNDSLKKTNIKNAGIDAILIYPHTNSVLRHGSEITLISVDVTQDSLSVRQKVQNYFMSLAIHVEYESIYGEKFVKPNR